jgi:DNA-binding response OmpR family regulator
MTQVRVLLAEDELVLARIVKESFEASGFAVVHALDGAEALAVFQTEAFDILVLDVMMPHLDGFSLAKEVRKFNTEVPILMLTSKSQPEDVVVGFNSGANDYLKKPFSLEELLVRVGSLVGRRELKVVPHIQRIGALEFDLNAQTLRFEDQVFVMTHKESSILKMLLEQRNALVDRNHILRELWGQATYFNGRSLDVFISKLRKKLAQDPSVKIITSKGQGFKLTF